MSDHIRLDIEGLEDVQRTHEKIVRDLYGDPMLKAMRDCTLLVQTDAKRLSPVDTGRLRSSITPEVRAMHKTVQGVVGSNVEYAKVQEDRRHYLEHAVDVNIDQIKARIERAIRDVI